MIKEQIKNNGDVSGVLPFKLLSPYITVTKSNNDCISVKQLTNFLLDLGFHSLKTFKTYLSEDHKWTGRERTKPVSYWREPHLTKLKIKGLNNLQPVFTALDEKEEDLSELENIKVYDKMPLVLTKEKLSAEDMEASRKFNLLFYDIEATHEDSFICFKLLGFETELAPIYGFEDVLKLCKKYINPFLETVLVAYNDAYDGNFISEVKRKYNTSCVAPRELKPYRRISNDIINSYSYISKMAAFFKTKNKKMTIQDVRREIDKGNLLCDSRYNPLSSGGLPHSSVRYYTFDMFTEMFNNSGSLKYNGSKEGCVWEASLKGDVYTYAKEDVNNSKKLFMAKEGVAQLETLFFLLKESKGDARALSIRLLTFLFGYEHLNSWNFIEPKYKSKYYIKDFVARCAAKGKYIEENNTIRYSNFPKCILRGGAGGVHSDNPSVICSSSEKKVIYDVDFSSYYPHLLIHPNLDLVLPEFKTLIRGFITERLKIKKTNKVRSTGLKIFLNSLYGGLSVDSRGGFPDLTAVITAMAKYFIIRLLRKLELYCYHIIDVNTDGVIGVFPRSLDVDLILTEFSKKTSLPLEKTEIDKIYYYTTGQYIAKVGDEFKEKGSWLNTAKTLQCHGDRSYNIINTAELLRCDMLGIDLPEPKILEIIGSGESKQFNIRNDLPFSLKGSLLSSVLSNANINVGMANPLPPLELSKKIVAIKKKDFLNLDVDNDF